MAVLAVVSAIINVLGTASAAEPKPTVDAAQSAGVAVGPVRPSPPVPDPPLPDEALRAAIHTALMEGAGNCRDAIGELRRIGDASSVPVLILTLARLERGPGFGPDDPNGNRFYCLDALRVITNHDAGRAAHEWQAWLDRNRETPQQQWIIDGFAEEGFPAAEPVDEAFAAALVRAADPKFQPSYLRTNALRVLHRTAPGPVVAAARRLLDSPAVGDRKGVVAALDGRADDESIDLLRRAASDREIEVAENALRVLNDAIRDRSPIEPVRVAWDVTLARAGVHILERLDDHSVVLGIGYGIVDEPRVVLFDLILRKVLWTYSSRSGVRTNAVRDGDRLYFVSDDRVLHCISTGGQSLWTIALTRQPDRGSTGPRILAANGQLFIPDGQTIYVVSSVSGHVAAIAIGETVSRHIGAGRFHVFGAVSHGPLLVLGQAGDARRVDTGVRVGVFSVGDESLCIVGSGATVQLQCLEEGTLREMWRAELPREYGGYHEVLQEDGLVYVIAQERALAFRLQTGERLWATNEFRSFGPFRAFARFVLTHNHHFRLEWRDANSGEVVAPLEGAGRNVFGNVMLVDQQLLVEIEGLGDAGLRMIDLPPSLKGQLPSRQH
jgi:hypothetical protein